MLFPELCFDNKLEDILLYYLSIDKTDEAEKLLWLMKERADSLSMFFGNTK